MKRGSSRLSTSGSHHRRLLKRKNLTSSPAPKARRQLNLGWEFSDKVGIGPLVVKESEPLEEEPMPLFKYPGPCALFGKYVDEMYPALRSRIISSSSFQHIFWLEILSPLLMFDANQGPVSYLRFMISSGRVCSLQMLYPLLHCLAA